MQNYAQSRKIGAWLPEGSSKVTVGTVPAVFFIETIGSMDLTEEKKMTLNIIVFAVYTAVMLAIGIISGRKTKTTEDFVLGGRKVSGVLSAFAYGTTYFSAVMFTLCGSLGLEHGLSVAWIGVFNALIGGWLAWRVLAAKTRRLSEEHNAKTVTELISKCFDSKFLAVFIPSVILVFLVPYSASVYNGLSLVFSQAFGVDFVYCALILAATTALYVTFGGYIASMLNAFVQGLITVIAVVAFYFVFFSSNTVGGLFAGLSRLAEADPKLVSVLGPKPLFIIATVLVTSFGAWGLPQMIHKFFTVKETEIKKGALLSMLFSLVIAGGMYFCGGFAKLFFPNGIAAADSVMPNILFATTGKWLFAVMFVMLIASSMSTLSSLVIVAASTFTEDIVRGIGRVKLNDKKSLLLTRVMCLIFIAASVLIALVPNKIITLLSLSWGAIASSLMAPYLYSLYGKTHFRAAACISSVVGLAVMLGCVIIWGKELATYFAVAAVLASFAALGISVAFCSARVKAAQKQAVEGIVSGD